MVTLFIEVTLVKTFTRLPSEKKLFSKRNDFLPARSKCFSLKKKTIFQKGLGVQESKQVVIKVVSLEQNGGMSNNCIVSDRKKQRKYMHIQIWFYRTKIEPSSKLFPRCGIMFFVVFFFFFFFFFFLIFPQILSLFTIVFFILTHLCRVDSSTSTLWTGSFQVGMVSG